MGGVCGGVGVWGCVCGGVVCVGGCVWGGVGVCGGCVGGCGVCVGVWGCVWGGGGDGVLVNPTLWEQNVPTNMGISKILVLVRTFVGPLKETSL